MHPCSDQEERRVRAELQEIDEMQSSSLLTMVKFRGEGSYGHCSERRMIQYFRRTSGKFQTESVEREK